jgi:N-acylneuraminate cytidylyltransferase
VEYLENGSIYVFTPRLLRESGARLGGKIAIYPMTTLDSIQIDSVADLAVAEDVLAIRARKDRSAPDLSRLEGIQLLVVDFDGVMTDNRVFVDENGRETVACHRGDGWGLARLREAGVETLVLSTETNPVVAARCKKLDISCTQGSRNKRAAIEALAQQRSLTSAQVAYVGNDVNDLECLAWAKVAIAPADAAPEALAVAHLVTPQCGGAGAVRQVADWLIAVRKAHDRTPGDHADA